MFKNFQANNRTTSETGFRYRGLHSSRLEYLTDAVFAFAITLLVIASEVPKTYVELQASMYDFIGFIACILMLFGLWNNHATYFLKYGLQDKRTKTLNFLFLFVLLFYIYPLKYLFSYIGTVQLINILHGFNFSSDAFVLAVTKTKQAELSVADWEDIMIRFGIGLLAMHSILFFMFQNGYRNRKLLNLSKREVYETKSSMISFLSTMAICIFSILVVVIGGGYYSGYSGMVYLAIPITLISLKVFRTKKMNELYPLKKPDYINRKFANKNSKVESGQKQFSAKANTKKNKSRSTNKKWVMPTNQENKLKAAQPKVEEKQINKNNKTED